MSDEQQTILLLLTALQRARKAMDNVGPTLVAVKADTDMAELAYAIIEIDAAVATAERGVRKEATA